MLKKLLMLIVLCLPFTLEAKDTYRYDSPQVNVVLTDEECTDERVIDIMDLIYNQTPENYKRAIVTWQGLDFEACYNDLGTQVFIIDALGDSGPLLTHDLVEIK